MVGQIIPSGIAGWLAKVGLISPIFSLYVNDITSTSRQVELALYAEDTAIIASSRKTTLLVIYLESYFSEPKRWLSEWRITINVSKGTAVILARS
jgi:hypothetical protein